MPRPRTPRDRRRQELAAASRAQQATTASRQTVPRPPDDSAADYERMRRDLLRFLQKRKFRLVTRWKSAMKTNIAQVPAARPFPFALIFRAFEQVLQLLKLDSRDDSEGLTPQSFLASMNGEELPNADQYMELFLSGRDVLADFIDHDASFAAAFPEAARQELRAACERAFRFLIDHEMREHARRHHAAQMAH